MAFEPTSLDDQHAFAIALYRALMPELDVSEFSHSWKWTRTQAGGTFGNQAHVVAVENDVMPDTATGDMADRWGNLRGVKRKTASPAGKAAALRFTGTTGTSVPDQTPLTHVPSGLQFRTVGAAVVGATGTVDVGVIAIDVGSKTRLNATEVLTLQTQIAGVQDDAELQLALDQGGDDAELDGDYVPRYLERFRNPPLGGTQSDFQKIATDSVDQGGGGMAVAFCYPLRAGLGTVDVAALHAGSGLFRIMTAPEVTALLAVYQVRRPVAMKGFRLLTVVAQAVNVHATIVDDGSIASTFDWDDTLPPTCLAWTPASRLLQLAGGARPSTMQANDRIAISDGATGKERVIESLSGADSVVLVADGAGDVPTAGASAIYSGGPLVEPSRRAVQALFDSLGTANPDTNRYGTWEGNLRPNAIGRAIAGIPGVLDLGALVAPAATVVANDPISNPLDSTIGLLIAGRILIRKAH
jgi:uncharacterized phage protein gp47/JayE